MGMIARAAPRRQCGLPGAGKACSCGAGLIGIFVVLSASRTCCRFRTVLARIADIMSATPAAEPIAELDTLTVAYRDSIAATP